MLSPRVGRAVGSLDSPDDRDREKVGARPRTWSLIVTRRVHPFQCFLSPRDNKRPLKLFQLRDTAAALELIPALQELGFEYGDPILNYPPSDGAQDPSAKNGLLEVDLSFVRPGDLIMLTTRPPLHDLVHGDRKQIRRGYTDLEERVFAVWRQYLEVCARSHVQLTKPLCREVRQGFESRRDMAFSEGIMAPYRELNALDGSRRRRPPPRRTAAFLLRVDSMWEGGPGLLGAFGMDGTSTMVWAYRLARDHSELLAEPGFVMAELEGPPVPPRPSNLRWAMECNIEIILRSRL